MQKYFKKFVSLVLALSLSVVLSVPAFAATSKTNYKDSSSPSSATSTSDSSNVLVNNGSVKADTIPANSNTSSSTVKLDGVGVGYIHATCINREYNEYQLEINLVFSDPLESVSYEIDWGDGTTTSSSRYIRGESNSFYDTADNIYIESGVYTPKVRLEIYAVSGPVQVITLPSVNSIIIL